MPEFLPDTILLVHGQSADRLDLRSTLEAAHYRIQEAATGRAGLEMAKEGPTLIVLDSSLPDMEIEDWCSRVRNKDELASMPILHLVEEAGKDPVALVPGTDGSLHKPFRPTQLVGVVHALVRLRRAERQVAQIARRWQVCLDSLPQMVWVIDKQGQVAFANARWRSQALELGEDPQADFVAGAHPDDQEALAQAWERARVGELAQYTLEYRLRGTEKTEPRWHSLHLILLAGRGDALAHWLATATDIDEHKRAQEALVRAKDAAEAANRAKTNFLSNMSHEIRTPLTSIMGLAGILETRNEQDFRDMAEMLHSNGQRLLDTLNAVLELAQLESGASQLNLSVVDLASLLKDAVTRHQEVAARTGNHLDLIPAEQPIYVRADESATRRVFDNLIGNSLKFTSGGSVTVRITCCDHTARVSIADTGQGIAHEFRARLFSAFEQESSGQARRHEGSGLGLAIVQQLVQAMHGRIEVCSEPGRGTTITIALPLVDAKDVPAPAARAVAKPGPVLVVEDNAHTVKVMRLLLRDQYDVDFAHTAEEALAKAHAKPYQLVFLDINLGEATGTTTLRELRAVRGYDRTIMVAFTAFSLPGDRERFEAMGFDAYLGKPFRAEQLMRLIDQSLESYRERIS